LTKCLNTKTLFKLAMLVTAGFALTYPSAYADVVYSLTLTPTSGPSISGTGLLTLETPIPLTGPFTANEGGPVDAFDTDLLNLTFTMSDGDKFSIGDESAPASAFFSNDTLENLSYNLNSPLPALEIGGTSYNFVTTYSSAPTEGTITFNPTPVTPTPEPT
jgi:hypothetical protein